MAEFVPCADALPELPESLAWASHTDGRAPHPPLLDAEMTLGYYCNCLDCCALRASLRRSNGWRYPEENQGMIAVKVG